MKILSTSFKDVFLLTPSISSDKRGSFFESFNKKQLEQQLCYPMDFQQENHSQSVQGVIRGLHYQFKKPQGKLVRVVRGSIFDVVVDIRKMSPTYGAWLGTEITEDNHCQIWIPPGFAHGFLVLSSVADVVYKVTDYWYPEHERCIRWNDPTIGIDWPIDGPPILSEKDIRGEFLTNAEAFE